jgi:hypothetical protein
MAALFFLELPSFFLFMNASLCECGMNISQHPNAQRAHRAGKQHRERLAAKGKQSKLSFSKPSTSWGMPSQSSRSNEVATQQVPPFDTGLLFTFVFNVLDGSRT